MTLELQHFDSTQTAQGSFSLFLPDLGTAEYLLIPAGNPWGRDPRHSWWLLRYNKKESEAHRGTQNERNAISIYFSLTRKNIVKLESCRRDFPGGLMVKTQHFRCRGTSSIPVQEVRSHMPWGTAKKRKWKMWETDLCRKGSRRLTFRSLFISLIRTNTKKMHC